MICDVFTWTHTRPFSGGTWHRVFRIPRRSPLPISWPVTFQDRLSRMYVKFVSELKCYHTDEDVTRTCYLLQSVRERHVRSFWSFRSRCAAVRLLMYPSLLRVINYQCEVMIRDGKIVRTSLNLVLKVNDRLNDWLNEWMWVNAWLNGLERLKNSERLCPIFCCAFGVLQSIEGMKVPCF